MYNGRIIIFCRLQYITVVLYIYIYYISTLLLKFFFFFWIFCAGRRVQFLYDYYVKYVFRVYIYSYIYTKIARNYTMSLYYIRKCCLFLFFFVIRPVVRFFSPFTHALRKIYTIIIYCIRIARGHHPRCPYKIKKII